MFWLLRRLFKFAVILIILAIIVCVAMLFFVSPDKFRGRISDTITSYLGRPVQISGPISWKLRPEAVLNLQELAINKSEQEPAPILKAKDIVVYFDLFSLMSGKLVVKTCK